MTTIAQKSRLVWATVFALMACFLAGCKEDTPKPSASGYYNGPMKPKSGAAKQGTDAGGGAAKNKAGDP